MARLNYAAPGVYVEEVPSAQQPIAGVGTNTVGFIGIVGDEIEYPVPNPYYDPTVAEKLASGLKEKQDNVAKLKRALDALQPKPAAEGAEGAIASAKEDLEKAQKSYDDANNELENLKKLPGDISSIQLSLDEANRQKADAEEKLKAENISESDKKNLEKQLKSSPKEIDRLTAELQKAQENYELQKKKEEEVQALVDQLQLAEQTLNDIQKKFKDGDLSDKDYATQKGAAEDGINKLRSQFDMANAELDKIQTDSQDKAKPYRLEKLLIKAKEGETKLCTNFSEYTKYFGSFSAYDGDAPKDTNHWALTHAVYGFFLNGGTRCFVARVSSEDCLAEAMENFESIEAVAIVAAPGQYKQDTWNILTAHCENCEDRFAILDSRETPAKQDIPDVLSLEVLNYDSPEYLEYLPQRNKNAAFYFPWIEVSDPAKMLQDQDPVRDIPTKYRGRVFVPPSGHIAGIYARTDEQRGVHKAPANAPVMGALNVRHYIGKAKQAILNPQGVNVIRNIDGNITVWGARTIGGDLNSEWKYVNVRRLFLFLRDSIDHGTQWVVFEPNDRSLWEKIRRNVSDFLRIVWRSGALFGSSPEEAYYVKCDDETNPPEERELGKVITEIGVAIVRPAEFVIFRITQTSGAKAS